MAAKRQVRTILLGIAYIPMGVVLAPVAAAAAVVVLALFLGAPLMVLFMFGSAFWYAATEGDARALIFPLLCALPIAMGGLLGWLTGAGWPGASWFKDEDEPAMVWDATTGSYVPSAGGMFLLLLCLIVTFVLGWFGFATLALAFGLPDPISLTDPIGLPDIMGRGSPLFVASSLIVGALVAKIVEAIARRRTAFRR
jgi:hypothetical protein